ncbi:glycosyltransferase [Zunongwangia sp.]|uniref:glycosyltransferase n=1 Tax=Zunongwangia sp. TaxID=1965325 RepID=UPI003AA85B99
MSTFSAITFSMRKKRILVGVLNWGLGHAARSIPIINALQKYNFEPIIASDGNALKLLRKEFPHLIAIHLPSYNIAYSKNPDFLKWKILFESPKILQAIKAEKQQTKSIIKKYDISGIFSDNRLGVRHKAVKSVFMTHQIQVLSGMTTYFSSIAHQKYIKKFDECWIPDTPNENNLSGTLSNTDTIKFPTKYIGILSRFKKKNCPIIYDYLMLLSGPEPQRTILEKKLLETFKNTTKKILFIRGVFSKEKIESKNPNIDIKNNLYGVRLQQAINSCDLVISRSGYTSLMDLANLEKKAFFIPTPGQFEQEYLANRLMKLGIAPYCSQDNFNMDKLKNVKEYTGFSKFDYHYPFEELFGLF